MPAVPDPDEPTAEARREVTERMEKERVLTLGVALLEGYEDDPNSYNAQQWKDAGITGVLLDGKPDSQKIAAKIVKLKVDKTV